MPLPAHAQEAIAGHLQAIQRVFKPGAKVMLVIDNGGPEASVMMGDADLETTITLMRALDAGPAEDVQAPKIAGWFAR